VLTVVLAVAAAAAVWSPDARAQWTTANQHKLVPAYFYPDWWNAASHWYRMCDAMETTGGPSTAVMNPASGPGTAANPDYQRVIDYCHARGQRVLAYVHTSYGSRPAAAVRADVDATYAFYPAVDGIFFDEMSNSTSTRSHYRALYTHVRTKPGVHEVVGNPGAAASSAWQLQTPVADKVVVFEGSAASYQRWRPPSWVSGWIASRFVHLVHAASQPAMTQACARSKTLNAGSTYVTDDVLPNPWDTLPAAGYWSQEISAC
jgi:hypothetical protein